MPDLAKDPELVAIQAILDSLQSLQPESQIRVIKYVVNRLELQGDLHDIGEQPPPSDTSKPPSGFPQAQKDIRTLRNEKSPKSAIEMAVLVAYYLSELAPIEQRQTAISTDDLERYFKEAKHRLPKGLKDVLPNAKKAGYFESVKSGQYRLNSVGYNLAVHVLPRKSGD